MNWISTIAELQFYGLSQPQIAAACGCGQSTTTEPAILARIRQRCTECGDCLLWQQGLSRSGMPIMRHEGACKYVRRVVYAALHGCVPPDRLVSPQCGQPTCVSPGCLLAMTPLQSKRLAASHGAFNRPERILRATATKRARSPFSEALIEQARSLPGTCQQAADATGISLSYVKSIRRGAARRPLSSPWAGLLGVAR